jgi:uncharacterized protein (DUF1015 family)
MAKVKPFNALRPNPAQAGRICELPYDVLSSEEARVLAAPNPLSFFHVSKPEVDLPPGINPTDDRVYAQGRENFLRLIREGALVSDRQPSFYLYRQIMGQHSQVGLVGLTSCQEYLQGIIKRHELTRPDKEQDRVRHIESLEAQTGPAFLVYWADPALDDCFNRKITETPAVDFVAKDQVRHTAWVLADKPTQELIEKRFAELPALYIADGHHRTAAAARVYQARQQAGSALSGSDWFLSVLFPHNQVQILPYNRVLKDLNGRTAAELLEQLTRIFVFQKTGEPRPTRCHQVSFYLQGEWRTLDFRPELTGSKDPLERLDASLLQQHVLAPLFGIQDPRTSQRINFVGGIRGTAELERLVQSGEYACAFSMFPTSIKELIEVADAGGLMPPKSTWFEPKLRDGMFSHLL